MKLKDWIAVINGIDEFDIFGIDRYYYPETKAEMLMLHGDDEIDEVFIESDFDEEWVVAKVYLK